MLDLADLKQLIVFAGCGTLTKAAEQLHLSQPTITRTMARIEDAFGVPLFLRGKNRIALNETGSLAVKWARKLLADAETAVAQVQACHVRLRTVAVESCAPAPLWSLLPLVSAAFPGLTISSRLEEIPGIVDDVVGGRCEIGVLPCSIQREGVEALEVLEEDLAVCLPREHSLAGRESLTFEDLNGFNCLLRSEIGFWKGLCQSKMPASRFLVQDDDFAFKELVRASSLPCFTTNLVDNQLEYLKGRKVIPMSDPEAKVRYRCIFLETKQEIREIAWRWRAKVGFRG